MKLIARLFRKRHSTQVYLHLCNFIINSYSWWWVNMGWNNINMVIIVNVFLGLVFKYWCWIAVDQCRLHKMCNLIMKCCRFVIGLALVKGTRLAETGHWSNLFIHITCMREHSVIDLFERLPNKVRIIISIITNILKSVQENWLWYCSMAGVI